MKRSLVMLLLGLLLCISGCGKNEAEQGSAQPQQSAQDTVQTAQPEENEQVNGETQQEIVDKIEQDAGIQAPDADDVTWDTLQGKKQGDGILLEASRYTMLLPSDWDGSYVAEETNNWLALYSKKNYDGGYGGLLCNIIWTTDPSEYESLVQYEQLGQVKMDGTTYQVVADIPQEDQCAKSGELQQQYVAMKQELETIFKTIDFGTNGSYTAK